MTDPRYAKLAKIMLEWSLRLKPEEKLAIGCSGPATLALGEEIFKQALRIGAYPRIDIAPENLDYYYYRFATEKQLAARPEVPLFIARWADKTVSLFAERNAYELAHIDPHRILLRTRIVKPVKDEILTKPWVLTSMPTPAMAMLASQSLAETEKLFFDACLQDYAAMQARMAQAKQYLDAVSQIRLIGPQVDLKMGVRGRRWCICAGQYNIPDGELFVAPHENETEGEIRFDFPTLRQGKMVEGVYLQFRRGRVVACRADKNEAFLRASIRTDAGASRLGEFAFGLNYGLKTYLNNVLFDEKIGGTIHLALGSAYPAHEDGGGSNQSAIHWDMVKDMRPKECQVIADGKVIFRAGQLLIGK